MATKWTFSAMGLVVVLLGGLAISAASASRDGAASPALTRATVKVSQTKVGKILVDARGRTLYLFTQETAANIVCKSDYLTCTKLWPPLMTTAKPRAGQGVNPRLLTTVKRTKPAGLQVVYNRHPLYFYVSDKKAGDMTGQAFYGIWYVVSPSGKAIRSIK